MPPQRPPQSALPDARPRTRFPEAVYPRRQATEDAWLRQPLSVDRCAPVDAGREAHEEWRQRLQQALGSFSSHFIEACLYRLLAACRLPGHGIPTSTSRPRKAATRRRAGCRGPLS
jgi:hypothetical protein